jgi:hypothetical protein
MMEWVLRNIDFADAYVDDVIIGSTGESMAELIANHERDVREVMETLREAKMIAEPGKASMFMKEVEFCGHVLREGRRSPSPGKLLSIQKWEMPRTVTQLRAFLGLTNYYSSYVHQYAELAGPLMSKLKLDRHEGRKGSTKLVVWTKEDVQYFEALKKAPTADLEVFRVDPDKPFIMHTDASDFAIGVVFEQVHDAKVVAVGFFSRKLTKSQANWTPREKETYAIVAALRKWGSWIGFQPLVVRTDHRSLEDWVSEHVDTPSGPRGRRARWHETLSQFNVEVEYIKGSENIVADAMSRYAYPASSAREDVCTHGSAEAHAEMAEIIKRELVEGRMVAMLQVGPKAAIGWEQGYLRIAGQLDEDRSVLCHVNVVTRSGVDSKASEEGEEVVEILDGVVKSNPEGVVSGAGSIDLGFRFQSQLPENERACHKRRGRAPHRAPRDPIGLPEDAGG